MYKMIGRVYRINVNKDDFYIGSTIKKLFDRQAKHNYRLNQNKDKYKLYEECRKNNITKITCELIEEKEIENKEEIRLLEEEYIEKLNPTLNSRLAYTGLIGLTKKEYDKEYYDKNKEQEKYKERKKEYTENNKERIKQKQKEYRENNKEKYKERRENNKERINQKQKEWRENNKEKCKQYRENNKDKISERQTEKIKCPICNKIVSRTNIAKHQKTMNCRKSVECFIQDE